MAILLITHDLGVVANMADEVVVIYHGEIMEAGTARRHLPPTRSHPYLKGLLRAVPHFDMAPGERLSAASRDMQVDTSSCWQAGRARTAATTRVVLLSAKGVTKSLHHAQVRLVLRRQALRARSPWTTSASTSAAANAWAWSAKAAAARHTVSKIIMRAVTPDAGTVTYRRRQRADRCAGRRGRRTCSRFAPSIQLVFQDPFVSLSPRMTVHNILSRAAGDPRHRRRRQSQRLRRSRS